MRRWRRPLFAVLGPLSVAAAAAGSYYVYRLAGLGAAYKAKILCSGVFVSRRDAGSVLENDLSIADLWILRRIHAKIDCRRREVTATAFGLITRRAKYHPGLGCTLCYPSFPSPVCDGLSGGSPQLPAVPEAASPAPGLPDPTLAADNDSPLRYPRHLSQATSPTVSAPGLPVPTVGADDHSPLLQSALDRAFSEDDPDRPKCTRAIVIIRKGRIVAERYAPGFSADTPLLGWSMTKSVTNALVGILVRDGRLALDQPAPVPEWREPGDPRGSITLNHLLRMSSGLRFSEAYRGPFQDVINMLLAAPDGASYAARKPLQAPPGTRWSYSSGTTNIISRIIREVVGEAEYLAFPRRALFERIGMTSAVLEPDASGTFVASSFMYASARDWARLGQLYLQDGVWEGKRILPEGWVKYSTTPAPTVPEQQYGAHFWLKTPPDFSSGDAAVKVPPDAFHAVGHEGQLLTVLPSKELVIVRLGLTRYPSVWLHDRFIAEVVAALSP